MTPTEYRAERVREIWLSELSRSANYPVVMAGLEDNRE